MARSKKDEGATQTQTSEEVLQLRKELAELREQIKSQKPEPFEQIRQAAIRGQSDNAQVKIRHFTDHKKVALYHTNGFHIGKKIGPLHPGLLEFTFAGFKAKGIILSTIKPTEEEIAEYKQTEEYKKAAARIKELKPSRGMVQTSTDVKKLAEAMSKLAGIPAEEVIQLKKEPVGV